MKIIDINTPYYKKVTYWGKLISITGSAQLFIQLAGFLCGILIIRLLSIQEYAFYTLANTMLGTMVMLADSGISNGIMAEGGKVWQDKKKMGKVLATGLGLRKKFGLYSLAISIPILTYLLYNHGANIFVILLIILSIIPAFFATLSDSFLEMSPKLHQDIKPLQINQIEVSIGRLVLTVIFLFILPFTFIALIANGIPRIYGNYKLRRISKRYACDQEKPDPIVRKNIMVAINRTFPIVLYHCFYSQISIWLISILGSTTSISQFGALGRIAVLFGFFGTLFSTLVIPRFSRLKPTKKILLKAFLIIQGVTAMICITIVIFLKAFPDQILWIFGEDYIGLNYELLLIGISSGLGLMAGVCSELVIIRGWFIKTYILIIVNLSSTIFAIMFLNMSSLIGVLYFNIIATIAAYLVVFLYGLLSIHRTNLVTSEGFQ